jgi:hypothetical protein
MKMNLDGKLRFDLKNCFGLGIEVGRVCVYEVFPVNFVMLSKEKKDEVLLRFFRLLNSLPCQVRLFAVKSQKVVEVGGDEFSTTYYRFFVESVGEPIDWLLEQCGFKYQPLTELAKPQIAEVYPKHIALKDGKVLRSFTVYQLPGTLLAGFICELYGLCERVLIEVKPLKADLASARMGKYVRFLKSLMLAEQAKGRLIRDELKLKHAMAEATYQNLITGSTNLFELKINLTVIADNLNELNVVSKKLKDTLQARFVKIDVPLYLQKELLSGIVGKKLTVATTTVGAFFPFVSADLIESPGGIFLGINRLTGAPVIFDLHLHMNKNVLVLGKSGSGKSFCAKIFLTRLLEKHKDLAFFVIDPENEYGEIGRRLGAQVLDISVDRKLGLDPVQIFSDSKDTAAGIIADLAGIEDNRLYQELRTVVGVSEDMLEAYQNSSQFLKDWLTPFVTGPDSFLAMGKPQEFSDRMIFNLSALHRQLAPSQKRSVTFQAANVLIFSKIWQILNNPTFLPLHVPKLVIVDELWLYVSTPASAAFLEGVSRRGRKRNITLLLNSQRLADLIESSAGKAVIENCATKILLRQDESAIHQAANTIGLSIAETETLQEQKPGQSILITDDQHTPVDFITTKNEYTLFTTKPTERITQTTTNYKQQ